MIHISTEIFFNVISFVFHFERLISQKKILLIHISPEGYKKQFFWTISIFAEGNHCLILLQKESLQCINILFSFERFISQKWIRLIDSDTKGFHPVNRNWIFIKWLIFSQKEIIFLSFCKIYFSNILNAGFILEIYITEESYPVQENGIY